MPVPAATPASAFFAPGSPCANPYPPITIATRLATLAMVPVKRLWMALKPVSKGLPWAWAASGATMRTLSTVSAAFAQVEEIANRTGKESFIRAKFGIRASSVDRSELLLLVHRSPREKCCLMTSRRDVIPHAHKTGIWGAFRSQEISGCLLAWGGSFVFCKKLLG